MAAPNTSDIIELITHGDTSAALTAIELLVKEQCPQRIREVIILQSRYNLARSEYEVIGSMTEDKFKAEVNGLNFTLLNLVQEIAGTDETDDQDTSQLRPYHCYTCDRREQEMEFKTFVQLKKNENLHFYYLYGGNRQSHRGFVKRIAYEIEGRAKDYLQPGIKPACEVLKLSMDAVTHPDFDIYRITFLSDLFQVFGIPVQTLNNNTNLLESTIADLLESPKLKGWRAPNVVCLYIRISHEDWDKENCIQAARWFINEFCQAEMPEGHPEFLFFFGVEYRENQPQVREEVEKAVHESRHFDLFSELKNVTPDHIDSWLDKYYMIEEEMDLNREDFKEQLFREKEATNMVTIEKGLKRLIDEYNATQFTNR
ncbi:MAG: hypothetical protein R2824_34220 [Saprospiraceae bacterium]|nr:hypothetical protein [Lewinella sp.]